MCDDSKSKLRDSFLTRVWVLILHLEEQRGMYLKHLDYKKRESVNDIVFANVLNLKTAGTHRKSLSHFALIQQQEPLKLTGVVH